jgi:histidyl-tRNA synthetase
MLIREVFLAVIIVGEQEIPNSFSENLVSGEQTSLDFEGLKKALL